MQIELKENEIVMSNVTVSEQGIEIATSEEDNIIESAMKVMGFGTYTLILRKEV